MSSVSQREEGFTLAGKVYLVDGNIAKGQAMPTLMHGAVRKHCRPEGVVISDPLQTGGGKQRLTVIDEGNLYRFIMDP